MSLLGGETAEMPGMYQPGEYDLVGTIVGWVERAKIIDGSRIEPGDALIGAIVVLVSLGLRGTGRALLLALAGFVLAEEIWRYLPHMTEIIFEPDVEQIGLESGGAAVSYSSEFSVYVDEGYPFPRLLLLLGVLYGGSR